MPAEVIFDPMPTKRLRRVQRMANPLFKFLFELIHTPSIENVLQPREFSIDAIAEVPMYADDGLANGK